MKKCLLCGEREAKQKNSHIISSFLVSKFFSCDGKGKRDRNIVYTLGPFSSRVSVGRNVPHSEIEKIFSEEYLTDERQLSIMKDTMALDDIFCTECESILGLQLESKYASYLKSPNAEIDGSISFAFWISIIWRLSVTKILGDYLDDNSNEILRQVLVYYLANGYLVNDENIYKKNCISYRILVNDEILQNKDYAPLCCFVTNKEHNIATLICGNIIICMCIGVELDDSYAFYGVEEVIKNAIVNDGEGNERITKIKESTFIELNNELFNKAVVENIKHYVRMTDMAWSYVKGYRCKMPSVYFEEFISRTFGSMDRICDKIDLRYQIHVLADICQKYANSSYKEE